MRKTLLIMSLQLSALAGYTQTFQSVTDNGNTTTNKLGIKISSPVYYFDHKITNNLSGIEKIFRISTYGGTNFSRRFNIEVLGNGANANDFYQIYGGELHSTSSFGAPVFATYENWSGFAWEWRGSSTDNLTLYGIESSATGSPATIQNTLINFNAVSGNVGVGTSSADSKLHVYNGSSGTSAHSFTDLTIEDDDHGMISIMTPNNKSGYYGFADSEDQFAGGIQYEHSTDRMIFRVNNHNSDMIIESDGDVAIGTTTTGSHKLAVEGSIGAREVKVEASGWSDFVFENDYELRTLEEVEIYIAENKHLPEIPSETEVTENGINLGEMNAKLLQKIEELTLYMIEMNKRVSQLEQENAELRQDNKELKRDLYLEKE